MHYRKFGRSDTFVSALSLGTWPFDRLKWSVTSRGDIDELLGIAIDSGINLIDTAACYGWGEVEEAIGSSLRKRRASSIFIASKVNPATDRDANGVQFSEMFPPGYITRVTDESLHRLGCESIFLQQLHAWSCNWAGDVAWLDEISRLKKVGKINNFGISVVDHDLDGIRSLLTMSGVDAVQLLFNLLDQSANPLIEQLNEAGIAVICRSVLYEGILTERWPGNFPTGDWRDEFFTGQFLTEIKEKRSRLEHMAGRLQISLTELALRLPFSTPGVTTQLLGTTDPQHLLSGINYLASGLLAADVQRELGRFGRLLRAP
jgi:aryl-alcohol dehydrogenase-like predicted oxidoreductase